MKKYFNQKGFTLIELLVVVAIIGILASIILASLGTARNRAKASRTQSEISSMRAAAELYYAKYNSYDPTNVALPRLWADTESGMSQLVVSAEVGNTTNKGVNASSWAFLSSLPDGSGNFCADSNGFSGRVTASTVLSSPTFKCPQ